MENKLYDVTALGELLIDFTENGNSSQGNPTFEANPGGAPCNVLAMLNRLGKKTAFIGKVGNAYMPCSLVCVIMYAAKVTHTIINIRNPKLLISLKIRERKRAKNR